MEAIVARRKNDFHFGLTLGLLMQSNETVRGEDPETGISNLLSTLKTPLQTENRPYQITVDDFKCLDPDPNSL